VPLGRTCSPLARHQTKNHHEIGCDSNNIVRLIGKLHFPFFDEATRTFDWAINRSAFERCQIRIVPNLLIRPEQRPAFDQAALPEEISAFVNSFSAWVSGHGGVRLLQV